MGGYDRFRKLGFERVAFCWKFGGDGIESLPDNAEVHRELRG